MSYRVFEPSLAPTALQDPYGQSYLRARGIVKDYLAQQARAAVNQRFPQYAAPDALGALGDERSIDQGIDSQLGANETNAAYALRLRDAWNIWVKGGTAWGILLALAAQGYTTPHIIQQNGLEFYLSGGSLVVVPRPPLSIAIPPASVSPWNAFIIYFPSPPSTWTSIINPPTAISAPPISELRKLRRIIKLWQPAWTFCAGIGVVTSGSPAFWGIGTWGSGAWGGTVVWFSGQNVASWGYPIGQLWDTGALPGAWGALV